MEYMKVSQAAERWGISDRRVRILCEEQKIEGVKRSGRGYLIPVNAVRPIDKRTRRGKHISPEALPILDRIDLKKAGFDSRTPMPAGEYNQMMKEFLISDIYHSCALSGNNFTMEEIKTLINGSVVPGRSLKEHLEIVGHRDAFLYIRNLSQDHQKTTERMIKDIHSLLMIDRPKDKGTYRLAMASIHGCSHQLPSPHLISTQMEELLAELPKSTLHPVESAVLFHLKLESIHPFTDGNGRLGRLLLNLLLMSQGYPAVTIRVEDKKRYIQSFNEYWETGTTIPLLELVGEQMEALFDGC